MGRFMTDFLDRGSLFGATLLAGNLGFFVIV